MSKEEKEKNIKSMNNLKIQKIKLKKKKKI